MGIRTFIFSLPFWFGNASYFANLQALHFCNRMHANSFQKIICQRRFADKFAYASCISSYSPKRNFVKLFVALAFIAFAFVFCRISIMSGAVESYDCGKQNFPRSPTQMQKRRGKLFASPIVGPLSEYAKKCLKPINRYIIFLLCVFF